MLMMVCIRSNGVFTFLGIWIFSKSLPHACGMRVAYAHQHPILSSQCMMSRSTRKQNACIADRDDDVPYMRGYPASSPSREGSPKGSGFPVVRPCPIKIVIVGNH